MDILYNDTHTHTHIHLKINHTKGASNLLLGHNYYKHKHTDGSTQNDGGIGK